MTNSSVSTYLDITSAAQSGMEPFREALDTEAMSSSAKVIAAIHKGAETVPEIPAKADLELDQVLGALGWLAKNGLVTVEQSSQGEAMVARLTSPAKSALDQS